MTEATASEIFSLPMYPTLTDEEQYAVCEAMHENLAGLQPALRTAQDRGTGTAQTSFHCVTPRFVNNTEEQADISTEPLFVRSCNSTSHRT